jgi:hypothetical protein
MAQQKSELKPCLFKASCSGGTFGLGVGGLQNVEGKRDQLSTAFGPGVLGPLGRQTGPSLHFKRTYVTIHLASQFHREIPNRFEPFHALRIRCLQVLGQLSQNVAVPNNCGQLIDDMVREDARRRRTLSLVNSHMILTFARTARTAASSLPVEKSTPSTTSSAPQPTQNERRQLDQPATRRQMALTE